jgi:hypothetical protein
MRAATDQRFAKVDDTDGANDSGVENVDKQRKKKARTQATREFFQGRKMWIIIVVIIIFLILGILIAVVVSKSKKNSNPQLMLAPSQPILQPGIPDYVGDLPESPMSAMPNRAWFQSASVTGRR